MRKRTLSFILITIMILSYSMPASMPAYADEPSEPPFDAVVEEDRTEWDGEEPILPDAYHSKDSDSSGSESNTSVESFTDDNSANPQFLQSVLVPHAEVLETAAEASFDTSLPVESVFGDITTEDWWYKAVQYAWGEAKLFQGINDKEFNPSGVMTRGMFITVLGRKTGVDVSNYSRSSFIDVNDGMWYTPYIQWATIHGIVNGVTTYKFNPDVVISRQEVATILYRYSKYTGNDTFYIEGAIDTFPDRNKVAPYAMNAMKWIVTKGGIAGYGNPLQLHPNNSSTRAEIAQIFYNLQSVLASSTLLAPTPAHTTKDITVISHRGSTVDGPAHSFQGYDTAIEVGSRYIEQDLYLSSDGVLVVSHGKDLNEATNGTIQGDIETLKWEEIQRGTLANGEGVHCLEEVFQRYGTTINYVIETRASRRHGFNAEDELIRLINLYGLQSNVILQSFSFNSLEYLKQRLPAVPTMLLFDVKENLNTVSSAILNSSSIDIYCPTYYSATDQFIETMHSRNKRVFVFFMNSIPSYGETRLNLCNAIDRGIDGFFVDNTRQAVDVLASIPPA